MRWVVGERGSAWQVRSVGTEEGSEVVEENGASDGEQGATNSSSTVRTSQPDFTRCSRVDHIPQTVRRQQHELVVRGYLEM